MKQILCACRDVILLAAVALWNGALLYRLTQQPRLYDFGRFYETATGFLAGETIYSNGNLNPPHFHLLLLPLAYLPPIPALAVWVVMGGASLWMTARLVRTELS